MLGMDGKDVATGIAAGFFLGFAFGLLVDVVLHQPSRDCIKWQGRWEAAAAPVGRIDLLADRPRGCPLPEVSP